MVSKTGRVQDEACPYRVGSLLQLTRACLGNPAGTTGVVYEVYARGDGRGAWGVSVLFPNGHYNGFSAFETGQFLEYAGETVDRRLAGYAFANVLRLEHDFRVGVFDSAFLAY